VATNFYGGESYKGVYCALTSDETILHKIIFIIMRRSNRIVTMTWPRKMFNEIDWFLDPGAHIYSFLENYPLLFLLFKVMGTDVVLMHAWI